MQVMYSSRPRMQFSSPSINCLMRIFRSASLSWIFFCSLLQRQMSLIRYAYRIITFLRDLSTGSYCRNTELYLRTELSRFTAMPSESDLFSNSIAWLSCSKLTSSCLASTSTTRPILLSWEEEEGVRAAASCCALPIRTATSSTPFSKRSSISRKGILSICSILGCSTASLCLRASSSVTSASNEKSASPSRPSAYRLTKRQISLQEVAQAGRHQKIAVLTITSSLLSLRKALRRDSICVLRAFQAEVQASIGYLQSPIFFIPLGPKFSKKAQLSAMNLVQSARACSHGDYYSPSIYYIVSITKTSPTTHNPILTQSNSSIRILSLAVWRTQPFIFCTNSSTMRTQLDSEASEIPAPPGL